MHQPNFPLEVAVFSSSSALQAQTSGASRIELNAPNSYPDGGLTPPVLELLRISPNFKIPIRIMIRPVGTPLGQHADDDDFMYTAGEFSLMMEQVAAFKNCGGMDAARGDGFVFGIVRREEDGGALHVDQERCSVLVQLARPFVCVFHRAFDTIASHDPFRGLEDLVKCGFHGLLSSGGPGSHDKHLDNIEHMVSCAQHQFQGKLQIIVGGGVRSTNVKNLAKRLSNFKSGTAWLHSACLTFVSDRPEEEVDTQEVEDLVSALL